MLQLRFSSISLFLGLTLALLFGEGRAQGTATHVGPTERVFHSWYAAGSYFLSTEGGYYKSPDGTAWTKIHARGMDGGSLVTLPTGEIFIFTYSGFEESTDGGSHWVPVDESDFSTRTVISDSAGNLYAGENDPVYVSHDKGATWTKTNPGASPNFFDVSVLEVGPDGAIYAGNQGITGGFLYRTTDHGARWKQLHSESMNDVMNVEIYPSGTILLWYSNKVLRSLDSGKSWSTLTDPRSVTYPVSAVFTDHSHGFALASGRVVRTTDAGSTWDSSVVVFDHQGFTKLFRGPNNTILASGTDGLYRLTETASIPSTTESDPAPIAYPNPASSSIHVRLPAHAELMLFDEVGRVVRRVANADGDVNIDAHDLASGVYKLAIRNSQQLETSQIVIQR